MEISYHKRDSRNLGRPMEFKRYGHAGRPMVVFPTSRGRFYQFEDSGAIGALAGFIDDGRIQVWTLDGIDDETFFNRRADPQARIGRHDAYFRYVKDEALPEIRDVAQGSNGGHELKPIFSGCSMGAYHASNFVFHYPELTAGLVALSGVYSTRDFYGDSLEGGIFYHSPLDYLAGLDDDGLLARLRANRMTFCCGQGAWEDRMIIETHQLENVLKAKHIPAWVDFWGTDVSHDWPWWHKQYDYFMTRWLDDDAVDPR